ncbi:LysR family transcriptional regulator [Cyanobium sp. T1B-Tous]|uniref:LysR substrate-binding domain-containing protein n=1 Tax=Cyanobium sp. T1B-Tous TaxID=2823721 RepID=UPI0020CBA8AA|nr:LysR substrate-binding domain-containing protein [Cyanobium sp. T1B-Tous]MCP9805911.1 LysR family transcriptional regulator [Cyanobium sp. T1B-Tous]
MVQADDLDALDLLIWLGTGTEVARHCHCNQSTISRRVHQALRPFGLNLIRRQGEWALRQDSELLALERQVHQLHRFLKGSPLRVDASYLAAPLLQDISTASQAWIQGRIKTIGSHRPLELLRERVLDAWITGMDQDLPQLDPQTFSRIRLLRTPLRIVAAEGHPLHGQGQLSSADLAPFPRLAPRPGQYPRTERQIKRLDFKPPLHLSPARHYGPDLTGAPPLALHYGTAITLLHQPSQQPLDFSLNVDSQVSLVVRTDVLEQPGVALLLDRLQAQSQLLATGNDAVRLAA